MSVRLVIIVTIKDMRFGLGLTQKEFAKRFNIPVRTLQKWEQGSARPPIYVPQLIQRVIELEVALKMATNGLEESKNETV